MQSDEVLRVSSEGGPLIVCDSFTMPKWHGAFDFEHFEQACDAVNKERRINVLALGDTEIVVWDMLGAGTADVIEENDNIYIFRYSADDFLSRNALLRMLKFSENEMKETAYIINIPSDVLVVLWAAEDGSKLSVGPSLSGSLSGDLSIGDGAVFIRMGAKSCAVGYREAEVDGIKFDTLELLKRS